MSPAEVVAHAGHVKAVAAAVSTAQQAGAVVRLDAGAYGQLCAILPVLLGRLQDVVIDGLATAAGSLTETGDRLRVVAEAYQSTDVGTAAQLNAVRDRL